MGLFGTRKQPVIADPVAGSNGFGEALHLVHEKRALTLGEGANVYAFETLLLPTYSAIGWGVQPRRQLRPNGGAVLAATQGITLQTLGDPGNITGMFVSQPLVNISDNSPTLNATPNPQANVLPQGGMS